MRNATYLQNLNPQQREAVEHLDGPLLVLAGAGSGKTRVITYRIAHIIATGAAQGHQILAVTFTNKAAGEMKQRVIRLLGPQGRGVWLSTFHSSCARILRGNAEAIGYKPTFTIYDEAESLALIKQIYKDKKIPDTQPAPAAARSRISRAKDRLIDPQEYASRAADFLENNVAIVYKEYQKRLLKNQAMDFDDLLMRTVEMFQSRPQILERYKSQFRYILVDEFQDTNHAQYELVRLLGGERRNVCVVGDDDQSIYAWRGADISNILNFESDFPHCKVVKLERNYRSTQTILDVAGEVVSKNTARKPKKLFTENEKGEKITLLLCGDEVDEAEAVAEKIRQSLACHKSPSELAILYRTNAQSRALEDSLRHKGIPYTIVGGIRFYERAEVKDILAYLRLLVNPDDDMAFLRIVNKPKRGIGKTTIAKIQGFAAQRGQSIFASLASSPDWEEIGVKGRPRSELEKLITMLRKLSSNTDKLQPQDLVARTIEETNYLDMLADEGTPEAQVRADNVKEIVAGIAEYCERTESPTLAGFLEEVSLITAVDTWKDDSESVTLMTLHSAKGLEFDTVFITGMEDGLFPLSRSFDDESDIEEERRLCYVGMTRAKRKLYLSLASYRRHWGEYSGGPSMFLQDIPERLLTVEQFNYWGSRPRGPRPSDHRPSEANSAHDESSPDHLLSLGATVLHDRFGRGTIVRREGCGENLTLTIRFQNCGMKKIMARYAALEVIGG